MLYLKLVALSALAAASTPALAAQAPVTRLVECGQQSCLLISGQRADAASPVRINGQIVATEGRRKWRACVPVATIRALSSPYARTISVTVADAAHETRLPVGMLGTTRDLAMLVVRVK